MLDKTFKQKNDDHEVGWRTKTVESIENSWFLITRKHRKEYQGPQFMAVASTKKPQYFKNLGFINTFSIDLHYFENQQSD